VAFRLLRCHSVASSSRLQPSVVTRCPVCGGLRCAPFSGESSLESERERLLAFHLSRIGRKGRGELEERASFTQDDPARLVSCRSCGLLLRWPTPSDAELYEGYAGDRYAAERLPEMIASQVALFGSKVPVLSRLLRGSATVLEIGSFLGGFLEACREAGWEALGLDPGRQVAESCRTRGLDVFAGTLEDAVAQGCLRPVDCIAIWNTFDQLPHPRRTLALAAPLVREGGILAIRVPHGLYYRRGNAALHSGSRRRRAVAERCLAWNNLLAFPYLHGHTIETLDALVLPFGFRRVVVRGDVLGVLSGRNTARWARAEERWVKRLQRAAIRREERFDACVFAQAPWLDVYYQRPLRPEGGEPMDNVLRIRRSPRRPAVKGRASFRRQEARS